MCQTSERSDVREVVLLHVRFDAVNDFGHSHGIDKVRRTDLHCRGAGEDVLDRIIRIGNAAAADDGDTDGLVCLKDLVQRQVTLRLPQIQHNSSFSYFQITLK